jgi:hypothetical protein
LRGVKVGVRGQRAGLEVRHVCHQVQLVVSSHAAQTLEDLRENRAEHTLKLMTLDRDGGK